MMVLQEPIHIFLGGLAGSASVELVKLAKWIVDGEVISSKYYSARYWIAQIGLWIAAGAWARIILTNYGEVPILLVMHIGALAPLLFAALFGGDPGRFRSALPKGMPQSKFRTLMHDLFSW